MKKVLVSLAILITTFSSCELFDELSDNDCDRVYEYTVIISGIKVDVIENGEPGEGPVQWSIVKYRCDGTQNNTYGTTQPVNGYVDLRFQYSYGLHNNYDRVVVAVAYRGVTSGGQRMD